LQVGVAKNFLGFQLEGCMYGRGREDKEEVEQRGERDVGR